MCFNCAREISCAYSYWCAKEEYEERKQETAESKKAGAASQGMQCHGLSQEKDDEDDLQDESPAKGGAAK